MTHVPDVDSPEALRLAADELDVQAATLQARARARRVEAQAYRRAAQAVERAPAPAPAPRDVLDALNGHRKVAERMLLCLDEVDEYSLPELVEHAGCTPGRGRAAIEKLIELGLVVRTGLKRGTRYHRAQEGETSDVPTSERYEELIRDIARELGTFSFADVADACDLADATIYRWLKVWVDAGALEVERVGTANVYAYVRPLPSLSAATHRPRSEPKPWRSRADVVQGGGASSRLSRREVRELVRAAERQGATMRETKHGYLLTLDGRPVGNVPKTASDHRSLDNARAELRRNGVTV